MFRALLWSAAMIGCPLLVARTAVADEPWKLWSAEQPPPATAELEVLPDVEFYVIKPHEPQRDGFDWLHGVALAWHNDKLYATFGLNPGKENTATEQARGAVSDDGGKTWSPLFTIDASDDPSLGVSHGVLLSHGGRLWGFQGAFYNTRTRVHTRAYLLDEATGHWQPQGLVAEEGFWPMQEPLKLPNGNWIMSGLRVGDGNPPAVAISAGDNLLQWRVVVLPIDRSLKVWGESTLLVAGERLINVSRFGGAARALTSTSDDYGHTWTESRPTNLPMATSKPYTGTLSTGQPYLVCTTTADSGGRRSPLTIAVGRRGEATFCRVFQIRDAVHAGPGESHVAARLSYPYAVEHAGKLYVGYSNAGPRGGNRNSAELAIVPVAALAID